LLDRSLVDRMVYAGERLVFEGAPILAPPLAQDQASRRPIVTDGTALDTVATCRPLSIVEQAKLCELRAKEKQRLAPDAAKAHDAFVARQSKRLAERTGMTEAAAAQVIERQRLGVLLPEVVLPFDDEELAGTTVADVLADPGENDLSAHVDFAALAAAGKRGGAAVYGPRGQGEFLADLGLTGRAEQLMKSNPDAAASLYAAVERLIDPAQMGTLFKALAFLPPSAGKPPGF